MNNLFNNKNNLFSNENLGNIGSATTPEEVFINDIKINEIHKIHKIIAFAKECGVAADETQIKELYEVAVMRALKKRLTNDVQQNYQIACEIYEKQVNFAHRTSNSILLQQYSTPLPLSYLAGAYVAHNQRKKAVYLEPSAGNGLLTVALPSEFTVVNEIDKNRRKNLEKFGNYSYVLDLDATKFATDKPYYDGIITNPPFGRWETEKIGGYPIQKLEFIMAIRALDTMKASGRAAIIIGGHTEWDEQGRVENGANRYFLSYLYHYYNVEKVLNIDGKMYAKQGTTFPIRLILINGRKATPDGTAPLKTDYDRTVRTFEELWVRMSWYFRNTPKNRRISEIEKLMLKAIAEMENSNI